MKAVNLIKNLFQFSSRPEPVQDSKIAFQPLSIMVTRGVTSNNAYSYYLAYRTQSDISACVREWKQAVGAGGWKLIVKNTGEDAETHMTVDYQDTLEYFMTWDELKAATVEHLAVTGNAYWALVTNLSGNVLLGVETLDPRTVSILTDQFGNITEFVQEYNGQTIRFSPEEIIHFKLGRDSDNEAYGFSPMHPILWEARTDLEAMMSNWAFFANNAVPDVQYILEEGMSDEEKENAQKMIKTCFGGNSLNRHKSGVLAGVKDVKILSQSHKDMEFLDGRKFITEKIAAAYGVPKFMLGYTETVNNNNGVELTKNYINGTIRPIEKLLANTITRYLLPRIGLGNYEHVFNPVTFNEAEAERRALEELKAGAITLRQYKIKTGKEITNQDENNPMIDAYIIHSGASAVMLEDVGVDPIIDPADEETTNRLIKAIDEYAPKV